MKMNSKVLKEYRIKYPSGQTQIKYDLECSCGMLYSSLNSSISKQIKRYGVSSCGCLGRSIMSSGRLKFSKELKSRWEGILSRTANGYTSAKKVKAGTCYENVTICQEWKDDFDSFYNWSIVNYFEPHLHIDRIDGSKGYSPDNCRYITQQENNRNGARSILTEEQVVEILNLHGYFSNLSICRAYGIGDVTNIAKGRIWNDVWKEHHTQRNIDRVHPSKVLKNKDKKYMKIWLSKFKSSNKGYAKDSIDMDDF